VYLFGLSGRCIRTPSADVPISNEILGSARLPVFWGDAELQGLHVGFFVGLIAVVFFWILLNRRFGL
jgi:simple sugar transport system permease protein